MTLGLLVGGGLSAQPVGPQNVAVLVNTGLAESVAIGEHYLQARGIPEGNLCPLTTTTAYGTTIEDYVRDIRDPFTAWLVERGLTDQVLFVVVTRGIPGVITDGGPPILGQGLRALDSFLADPFDAIPGDDNPYFDAGIPFRRESGCAGYLVTRLDGPSLEVALALVDRALEHEEGGGEPGRGWFDQEPVGSGPVDREVIAGAGTLGNGWIAEAHAWLDQAGFEVHLDANDAEYGTAPAPLSCPAARWYLGWYEAWHYNDAFQWLPGAVGVHIDSFSAMNFREPGSWCAGALTAGITATAGAVWEPTIQDFVHGHRMLRVFAVDGLTLAEAAWQAIPRLRWMIVVFGDPLLLYTPETPTPPEPPIETDPDTVPAPDTLPAEPGDSDAPLGQPGACSTAAPLSPACPWWLIVLLAGLAACRRVTSHCAPRRLV